MFHLTSVFLYFAFFYFSISALYKYGDVYIQEEKIKELLAEKNIDTSFFKQFWIHKYICKSCLSTTPKISIKEYERIINLTQYKNEIIDFVEYQLKKQEQFNQKTLLAYITFILGMISIALSVYFD